MDVSRPRDKTDIEKIMRRVAENIHGRSMVVLISDLFVDREALFRGIDMLRHGRHDILVFHVMDHEELIFPFTGTTRFEGMEEPRHHPVRSAAPARQGYIEVVQEYLTEVRRGCAGRAIDYQLVHTGDYLDAALSKFLHHRMAMMKSPISGMSVSGQWSVVSCQRKVVVFSDN